MTKSAPNGAHDQGAQNTVRGPRRFGGTGRSCATAGQSLIVALIALSFLTAIMGTVTIELLTESRISNARQMQVTAFYVARAGIEAGVNQLLAKSPGYESLGQAWHSNQKEFGDIPLGGGTYKVAYFDPAAGKEQLGIADEESKLNINKAEPAMLHRLDAAFTDELVKAIVERREKRTFISLDEVSALKETPRNFMTKERESLLTVWGDGKVNVNTAPPAVLRSVGVSDDQIKKIETFRKENDFKSLGDAKSYVGGVDDKWLTTSSSYFSITAQGFLKDNPGVMCKLREVVQRKPEGLQVLQFEQVPFYTR